MKYVPELRFPEFKGEWEEKRLEQVLNIFNGYAFSSKDATQSGVPWVKIANVGILNMKKEDLSFLPLSFEEKYSRFLLYKDDIVLALTRPILNGQLKIAVIDQYFDGSLLNQRVGKLLTEENKNFIYYYLQKGNVVNAIDNRIAGTDPPNLAPSEINSLKIRVCSYLEQEKIASFLTSIDEKISLLKGKEEALDQYKKGLMQQLFSQELRFKDDEGNDFPDWEEKRLEDIGVFISGIGFSSSEQGGTKGTPFYKVSDMNLIGNERVMNSSNNYVTAEQIKNNKYRVIIDASIIFAKVGAAIFLERKRISENFIIDNNMMSFTPKGDISYFYYLFTTIRLSKYAQVGALPSYNASDLKTIKTQVPSLPEQKKIASFLGTIDDKIALVQQELAHLENWKRGLLQQLFV